MNNPARALACILGLCALTFVIAVSTTVVIPTSDVMAQATDTKTSKPSTSPKTGAAGDKAIDPNSDAAPMDWGDSLKRPDEETQQRERQQTSTSQKVAQVFLGLVVVIDLIVGLGYVAKMLMPKQAGGGSNALMEVLCKQFIDPKHKLVAVKINQRILIVGVSPNQITHLLEITDPEEVAAFTDTYSIDNNPANRLFNKMLKRDMDKLSNGTPGGEPAGTPIATADSEAGLTAKIDAIRDDLKSMRKDN